MELRKREDCELMRNDARRDVDGALHTTKERTEVDEFITIRVCVVAYESRSRSN